MTPCYTYAIAVVSAWGGSSLGRLHTPPATHAPTMHAPPATHAPCQACPPCHACHHAHPLAMHTWPPSHTCPPCGQNHRRLWKYNLAPTSLRTVMNEIGPESGGASLAHPRSANACTSNWRDKYHTCRRKYPTLSLPQLAANIKAVCPLLLRRFTLTPASSSKFTTLSWPT